MDDTRKHSIFRIVFHCHEMDSAFFLNRSASFIDELSRSTDNVINHDQALKTELRKYLVYVSDYV